MKTTRCAPCAPLRRCATDWDQLNPLLERSYGARLAMRIGVNTGEVVTSPAGQRDTFVTGDAVNTAARLEQAAGNDEILLGELT